MKKKLDQRGITLVEIVVVLMLFAVIGAAAGSLILSSSRFFQKSVVTDMDKFAADEIHKYAVQRLTYATSVLITNDEIPLAEPYSHYITVQDGRFIMDGQQVYTEEYYHGRSLKMESAATTTQVMLNFLLCEGTGAAERTVYRTGISAEDSALRLMNIVLAQERPPAEEGTAIHATGRIQLGLEGNFPDGTDDYIYFGFSDLPALSDEYVGDGTVADEIKFLDPDEGQGNNKGQIIFNAAGRSIAVTSDFDHSKNWNDPANADCIIAIADPSYASHPKYNPNYFLINAGDFFLYDGEYYRALKTLTVYEENNAPGVSHASGTHWKKVTAEWTPYVQYWEGNVVSYNGVYYRMKLTGQLPGGWDYPPDNFTQYWEVVKVFKNGRWYKTVDCSDEGYPYTGTLPEETTA